MNFKESLTTVRSEIDERGSDGFFLDADIKRWLNEAQRDIAKKTLFLQETFTDTVTGTEITLPTDFIKLHKFTIGDNELEHINRNPDQGYAKWNGKLMFNFSIDNANIKLYYYRYPTEMTTDLDESEVPLEYQDLLNKYAKHEAKLADEDPNTANVFYQQYLGGINEMKKEYGKQNKVSTFKVFRHK